jgi:hypothetical protein
MVQPEHSFERCKLHGFLCFPWYAAVQNFGLVEHVDGFGQDSGGLGIQGS